MDSFPSLFNSTSSSRVQQTLGTFILKRRQHLIVMTWLRRLSRFICIFLPVNITLCRVSKVKILTSISIYWLVRFCEDFIATVKTTEVGPVPALLVSFLQQAVASIGTIVGPLSACLPEDLVGTCSFNFFSQNCGSRTTSHSFVPFVQAFLNLQHLEKD